jgi:DNA-binding transcriptional regulator YiaG
MDMLTPKEIRAIMVALRMRRTTELAYRVGVTDDAVRKWLRGVNKPRGPSLILLHQLAEEAGIQKKVLAGAK